MARTGSNRGRRGGRRRDPAPRLSARFQEDVLASFTDAVIVTDPRSRLLRFNPAAEELFRLPRERVLGQPCRYALRRFPVIADIVESVLSTVQGESRAGEELVVRGRPVPVRLTCRPIHGERGRLTGTTLVVQDLTGQRKLEEAAQRNESLARLGTAVAGLAHEIRNPLAGIKGAAQLLERQLAERRDLHEHTGVIAREADRLGRLLEDLLTLGGPARARMTRVNIHQVIHNVLDLIEEDLTHRGFRLGCEFDPSLPDIHADESQLAQVLLNLIRNAMDAMSDESIPPERRKIVLRTRMETDFHILRRRDRSSKFLRLEVADRGPGITASAAARIFEPFYTTKARGTGLGLAISHRIVSEHGGTIRAEPDHPHGTIFKITLPVVAN